MPPKKVCRSSKKKKKQTINNSTQPQNPTTTNNPPPPPAPPSSFLDEYPDYNDFVDQFDLYTPFDSDDSFDFDDPFDLTYEDYDDFTNPFDPSYHNNFIIQKQQPPFTFKVVDDLDVFIGEGGNSTTQALFNLPLSIFLDILSRLPIKLLAVCRCVCKTRGTLIHHPRFTKLHHLKATQKLSHPFAQNSLLFHVSESLVSKHIDDDVLVFNEIFLLENEKDDNFENGVVVNPQFMPPTVHPRCIDFKFEVIGSCNGLICLGEPYHCHRFYVCNPVIGEYLALPLCQKKWAFEIVSGFGFDQVANEYKVVKTSYNFRDLTCSTRMEAEVYTLGSGKWRDLGKFSLPHISASSHVFVNGALHWMATKYNASELIVAFDMGKEKFQVVSSPPFDVNLDKLDSESSKLVLGELGGNLCLFDHFFNDRCQVWVRKGYGVKDSWAKEYVISRKVLGLTRVCLKPVKLMENGNILLLVNNQCLVYYNPRKKQFHKLKINLPPIFDAITHVGSFISLKDFVAPTDGSQHSINTGGWYGVMKSITSQDPGFDVRGWKLNEQMRKRWSESH